MPTDPGASAQRLKRRVVGLAGHIDHGKTALVRALTGMDGDRLPEEKRRGITIDLGFASLRTPGLQIGFIDVPGHEKFVKNMLAGIGGIDAVVLVVACDESIKPQTREHFAICNLLRIPAGVVALTKSDLVEPDIIDLVRMEVAELVGGSFLEKAPVIPVSSMTGQGLDQLKQALFETVQSVPDRISERSVFRLPIDRAFTIKGFGSVVTGTAVSGQLPSDSEVQVLPIDRRSRARNVEVHGERREGARAGERVSLNLSDIPLEDLHRGLQVVTPGTLRPSQILTVELSLLSDASAMANQTRIRFHHFSAELLGTVRIVASQAGKIAPGATCFAQIRLESPVVAVAGDRFVIRRYSPATTVGGGVILDPHAGKLSAGTRPELLRQLASKELGPRVREWARLAGLKGLTRSAVMARTGLVLEAIEAELNGPHRPGLVAVSEGSDVRWIDKDVIAERRTQAMQFLRDYFESHRLAVGVPKSEFIQKIFPSLEPQVVAFLLADFARESIIELQGDLIHVPGRAKKLAGAEADLAGVIERRFLEAGLKSPPVSELIQTIANKPKVIEGVVSFLVKSGVLVRLAEGVYVHRQALEEAREKMKARSGTTLDVAAFKEFFGLSRKVAIPLLEYFDRMGVTKRVGDQRQVL